MKLLHFVAVCALIDRAVIAYQWDCGTDPDSNDGTQRIPGVNYDVNDDSSTHVIGTVGSQLNIYPVGAIDDTCRGEVTAIEFCYQYSIAGAGEAYFNWTVLILEDDGSSPFTITHLYSIESRPSDLGDEACFVSGGSRRCCFEQQLTRPFTLETNFAFGVTESPQGNTHQAQLLGFHPSVTQYTVNTARPDRARLTLSVGSDVPRVSQYVPGEALRLIWFVVEPNGTASGLPDDGDSTTTETSSEEIDGEDTTGTTQTATTMQLNGTMMSTSTEEIETAGTTGTTFKETSSQPSDSMTSTSEVVMSEAQAGLGPAAVGGAVGGVIVVALITTLVIIIVVVAVKRGRMGSLKVRDNTQSADGYNNALYVAAGANGTADNAKVHLGPGGVSFSNVSYEYVADGLVKSEELGHDYSLPIDAPGVQPTKGALPSAAADGNAYASAYEVPLSQTMKNNVSSGYEEDIYMVPASDEYSLYSQLSQIKIHTFTRDAIRLTELLGSGQFGKVHRGEWTNKVTKVTSDVAVKTLKEGAGELEKVKFLQEAAIMGQFSHPNVVKLYGVITEGEPVMLIIELLLKGDLREYLCAARTGQSSDLKIDADLPHTLLSFCRQISSGMSYLASKAFVHRDLAARNILVSEDDTCKIADFGMSRDLADTDYYVSHGGKIPVKWTSPEALNYKKYSTASDVWSFGCVMYEIWSLGHKPFESLTNQETIKVVDRGVRLSPPPGCPRSVYKQMINCWHPSASSRPDFVSVVQQLSLPDTKLLKWSEEDKAIDPKAATLGAGLERATGLYKDLQEHYITKI